MTDSFRNTKTEATPLNTALGTVTSTGKWLRLSIEQHDCSHK